jgi:hypothetical protein
MTPDITTSKEASGIINSIKEIWSSVKSFFNWRRKHFENKIDVDVASYAGAIRVDTMSPAPAIEVMLKICNFSSFRRKIENVTASITFKKERDWGNIVQNETIVVAKGLPRSGFTLVPCRFKLTDAQIRSLNKYHNDFIIEVGVHIGATISSLLFTATKYTPNIDILVKPWPKGTNSSEKE